MSSLISTCIKPPCADDYCVDLRTAQGVLLGCFNSSNTVCAFSLPSLQPIHAFPTNSSSVLSEIASSDSNQVFWSDRSGTIGSIDLRSGQSSTHISTNEEIFSIDTAGFNLASSSNKQVSVYDIRTYKPIQQYTELYADENDILCVRIHKINTNWVLSCCEDSLMAFCDVNSIEDDNYNLINVEESALKVGFINDNVFCVTLNSIVAYDIKHNDPDAPLESLHKYKLNDFQSRNPEIDYFIDEFYGSDHTILAGTHS